MTEITYVQPDGSTSTLDIDPETSVMRAALLGGVPGILGECGGQAMCATCHVYVFDDAGLPSISEDEDEMLESVATERTERSRLSCQLKGLQVQALTVEVPECQL